MKTILVPLDGSAIAEQVLPFVRTVAPLMGAKVKLLHVLLETSRFYRVVEAEMAEVYAREPDSRANSWDVVRQNSENYLAVQAAKLRAAGIDITYDVRLGAPAELIVEVAEQERVDLIAMATHGYSGFKRWTLGSVTDKVIHAAHVPVAVVRGVEKPQAVEQTLKRILVPLDGSALARQALPFAAELATQAHGAITLLTVATPPVFEAPEHFSPAENDENALAEVKRQLASELGGLTNTLREHDVAISTIVRDGLPADMIIEAAEEQKADLIVMATHGYSGLKRWAVGSVADKVLHAATTPLVLVRTVDVG